MPTLYTFGDSYTEGHGCKPGDEYYENYNKNNELIWPELVANHYNIELVNKGHRGCSNEIIMDNIINQWDNIKSGDIIIIGKTYSHRFDIPNYPYKDKLVTVFGISWFNYTSMKNLIDLEVLKKYLVLFKSDSDLYDIRHYQYLNFLKTQLEITKDVKVVLWDNTKNIHNIDRITFATKGKIVDGHFSYQGHMDFSKWIINKIDSIKHIKKEWI